MSAIRTFAWVWLAAALLGLAAPRLAHAAPAASGAPVLLVGVDGLEWDIVLELLRAGELPHLGRLMAEGSYGELETLVPTRSPVVWTTIATGKPPAQHGILDFVHRDPETREITRLYTSTDRQVKAFWDILSQRGRRVAVIGWWMTFPVDEVNGLMVAQTNTGRPRSKGTLSPEKTGQVHPPEREAAVLEVLARMDEQLPSTTRAIFGAVPDPLPPMEARFWKRSRWAFRADATYAEIARAVAAGEDRPDVIAVYLGGTDVVGHRFWRYMRPAAYLHPPSPELASGLGGVIPRYYVYVDRIVGELVAALPEGARVLIVSDHGMHATRSDVDYAQAKGKGRISASHEDGPSGVFIAAGSGIRHRRGPAPATLTREDLPRVGSVLDLAPTLLALVGLPAARDMPGEAMPGVLEEAVLAGRPPPVPSYETPGWAEARRQRARETPEQDERIEQLRALGYLDGSEEPGDAGSDGPGR